jgi:hypothetical protein
MSAENKTKRGEMIIDYVDGRAVSFNVTINESEVPYPKGSNTLHFVGHDIHLYISVDPNDKVLDAALVHNKDVCVPAVPHLLDKASECLDKLVKWKLNFGKQEFTDKEGNKFMHPSYLSTEDLTRGINLIYDCVELVYSLEQQKVREDEKTSSQGLIGEMGERLMPCVC